MNIILSARARTQTIQDAHTTKCWNLSSAKIEKNTNNKNEKKKQNKQEKKMNNIESTNSAVNLSILCTQQTFSHANLGESL